MESDKLQRQLDGLTEHVQKIGGMIRRMGAQANIRNYDDHAEYLLNNGLSEQAVIDNCVQYMEEEAEGRYFAEDSMREAKPHEKFRYERDLIVEDGIKKDDISRPYRRLDILATAYDQFLDWSEE